MTRKTDPVAELLRTAGPRAAAPAGCAQRVEAAVRLEWQDVVQKRAGRRRAGWVAASCVTSAALIALLLHGHAPAPASRTSAAPVSYSPPAYTPPAADVQRHGAFFRMNNDDRPPDRGVPRHVLANYSGQMR